MSEVDIYLTACHVKEPPGVAGRIISVSFPLLMAGRRPSPGAGCRQLAGAQASVADATADQGSNGGGQRRSQAGPDPADGWPVRDDPAGSRPGRGVVPGRAGGADLWETSTGP